jgi:hypothetical protein
VKLARLLLWPEPAELSDCDLDDIAELLDGTRLTLAAGIANYFGCAVPDRPEELVSRKSVDRLMDRLDRRTDGRWWA